MDLNFNFFRRANRSFAAPVPAGLDYGVLTASLGVVQAAGGSVPAELTMHPLVELLTGGSRWREAVRAQGGCFHAGMTVLSGKGK